MKPLDLEYLIRDLKKKMAIHTPNSYNIPYSFKPFPKNIMDESHNTVNNFLNPHLSEMEEADHCNLLSKPFKIWFANQLQKYHKHSGVFNHDNFIKKISQLIPPSHVLCCGMMLGNMNTGGYRGGLVPGDDIEGGGTTSNGVGFDGIRGCKPADVGVVDEAYDQIAQNFSSIGSGSNVRQACYDDLDDNNTPDNLLAETGSYAGATGFPFESVTEFQLTTTQVWLNSQHQTAGQADAFFNSGSALSLAKAGFSFGAFPDPFTSETSTGTFMNIKIGHT